MYIVGYLSAPFYMCVLYLVGDDALLDLSLLILTLLVVMSRV
jgi:hypothetical protein